MALYFAKIKQKQVLIKHKTMGQMKWIYSMIENGSYDEFKKEYIKCVLTNKTSFQFDNKTYVKSFARSVVKYVDDNKLLQKYTDHLEEMLENQAEWEVEIQMGK